MGSGLHAAEQTQAGKEAGNQKHNHGGSGEQPIIRMLAKLAKHKYAPFLLSVAQGGKWYGRSSG